MQSEASRIIYLTENHKISHSNLKLNSVSLTDIQSKNSAYYTHSCVLYDLKITNNLSLIRINPLLRAMEKQVSGAFAKLRKATD